jgi:ribosomal protein S27AE
MRKPIMTEQERLQCNGISISGLNPADRQRIENIGFDRWLDEIDKPPAAVVPKTNSKVSQPKRRTRRSCVRCGDSFLAKREDAKYCSVKCRIRASRYPDGQTETDNNLAGSGTRMNTGANDGDFGLISLEVLQGHPA